MDKFDIRIQCLKIALNERYKDDNALRNRVDTFYGIVTNGDTPPDHVSQVMIINANADAPLLPVPGLAGGKENSGNPGKSK